MKKSFFTLLFAVLFLACEMASAGPAERFSRIDKKKLKSDAAVVCVALLAATASVAVVARNMSPNQHAVSWGGRTFRNRSSFVLFLSRGVFRKKLENDSDELDVDDVQILDVRKQFEDEIDYSTLFSSTGDETLAKYIFISSRHSSGAVAGFFVLPGFLASFQMYPVTEAGWQFTLRSLDGKTVLFDGRVAPLTVNLTPLGKVAQD